MKEPTNPTLAELREMLTPIFERNKVKKAAVFGSYARGDEDYNDFDFIVEQDENAGWLYFGLLGEMQDSLNKKIDIIDYSCLDNEPIQFRENVIQDERVFYES